MRPRDATRSLKAITCVNNTQNSHRIIAFVLAQVQRDLSCSGAVVAAARSSSSALSVRTKSEGLPRYLFAGRTASSGSP